MVFFIENTDFKGLNYFLIKTDFIFSRWDQIMNNHRYVYVYE